MKLCRFEPLTVPGSVHSGIVHGGKVYETDGTNPVAVHEAAEVRLLAPVGRPPSVRLFSAVRPAFVEWIESESESGDPQPTFCYLNPATISGPNSTVPEFPLSSQIGCKPCVGFVVDQAGRALAPEEAEGHVVGITLSAVLFASDLDRDEMSRGLGTTRSHDVGLVLGPALTTPDELEELRVDTEDGGRLKIVVAASMDGEEFLKASLEESPWSMGRLIAYASESAPLMAGDVFLVSLGSTVVDSFVEPGSDIRIESDRLGNLLFRYGDLPEE